MEKRDKDIVLEFKKRISSEAKKHLKKIIVFGSRARGDATEDSDLDVVVLVDKNSPSIENNLDNTAYDVMWDHDFKPILSLKVFTESKFNDAVQKGYSFYRYVEEEGVAV